MMLMAMLYITHACWALLSRLSPLCGRQKITAPIKFEGGCGVELADLETGLPITILRPLEVQRRLGVGLGLEPRKEKDAGRGI